MKRTLALLAFAAIITTSAHAANFLGTFGGHDYYKSVASNLTITQARAEAATLGGYVVSLNSAAEEAWVASFSPTQLYWIGLSDEITEGTYLWDSGEPVTYFNPAGGWWELTAAADDWCVGNWSGMAWKDLPSWRTAPGVYEVEVVPEPASMAAIGLGLAGLAARKRRSR